jgi:hypothetical protein
VFSSFKGRFFRVTTMALFTVARFPGVDYDRPVGVDPAAQPAHPADAITLQMSDGTVQTVCDSLETGLKLITYMRALNQRSCLANDDVAIVSINGIKGLAMEQTLLNQRLLHSFLPVYIGGAVRWVPHDEPRALDGRRSELRGRVLGDNSREQYWATRGEHDLV